MSESEVFFEKGTGVGDEVVTISHGERTNREPKRETTGLEQLNLANLPGDKLPRLVPDKVEKFGATRGARVRKRSRKT